MRFRLALIAVVLAASSAPLCARADGAGPAGIFTVNGAVGRAVTLSVGQLAALPLRSVTVTFLRGTASETHSYRGPLVSDVVAVTRPNLPAGGAHQLMLTFLATDGYQVSIAYGEIDGGSGNKQALLAFEEDGRSLAADRPVLVMPGDVKGGRDVTGVSSVTVSALPPPPTETPATGSIIVTGSVSGPKRYSFADLKALPQATATVTFTGPNGPESHQEKGPLLTDLYSDVGLAPPAGVKEGALRLVTAANSGTEQTAVGVGETAPEFGAVPALLSLEEDGNDLSATGPRLVVPHDQKFTRDIKAVQTLTVLNPTPNTTVAPGLADRGVRLVNANGIITSAGGASSRGDLTGKNLSAPIVAADTAAIPDSYWLAGRDGGVFNFGGAGFYGSTGGLSLNKPIVDLAASPTAKGYWLTASDGGIFAFGDAAFFGSTGSLVLNKPAVAMAPTPTGKGYLVVASDGGVFAFGDGRFNGSTGNITLVQPIVDFALTPSGNGYLLLAADGGVFAFGDARYVGRDPSTKPDAIRLIPSVTGTGYRIVHSDATVASVGSLPPLSKVSVNGAVVAATA
ncbi:MAG: hypothetical protein QOJ23_3970 [Actinomycetota bacterium]|jgi:hypothetical protein|nr:hypothetical protein [Actinomycetota bacterium]